MDVFKSFENGIFNLVVYLTAPLMHFFAIPVENINADNANSAWLWGEFLQGNIALALFCAILIILLRFADNFAVRCWPAYRRLPNRNRQLYVLVNLSKGICLAIMFFSRTWINGVYDAFVLEMWNTVGTRSLLMIKNTAAFYVATDVVALLIVPKLPQTTLIHHYVTWLLTICIFGTDVRQAKSNVVRMIILYGAWSTVPYMVNIFLALRRVYDDEVQESGNNEEMRKQNGNNEEKRKHEGNNDERVHEKTNLPWIETLAAFPFIETLAAFSLIVYAIACICNWSWHLHWFIEQIARGFWSWHEIHDASLWNFFVQPDLADWWETAAITLYSVSVAMLARDDIILMQWLWQRARKNRCVGFFADGGTFIRRTAWRSCKCLFSRTLSQMTTEEQEEKMPEEKKSK